MKFNEVSLRETERKLHMKKYRPKKILTWEERDGKRVSNVYGILYMLTKSPSGRCKRNEIMDVEPGTIIPVDGPIEIRVENSPKEISFEELAEEIQTFNDNQD